MTPTLTPMWHANQRWVPLEAYEALLARAQKLEAAGNALALLHLAECTQEEREADTYAWVKAKKDAQ